jgi:foldase protein PrsA
MHGRFMTFLVLLLAASLLLFACGKEGTRSSSRGNLTEPAAPTPASTTSSAAVKPTAPAPTPPAASETPPPTTSPAATSATAPSTLEPAATPTETPSTPPPVSSPETPPAPAPTTTPPAPESTPTIDQRVAVINGHGIEASRLDQAVAAVLTQYQQLYSQFGINLGSMMFGARGRIMDLEMEVEALARLITQVIVDDEIARRGIVITDPEAAAEFDKQYEELLATRGLEWLTSYAAQNGMTLDGFKEWGRGVVKQQMASQALQRAVAGPVTLSDEDLEAYWLENRANYDTEEEIHASHILVPTEQSASEVLADLEDGADFATLAKERSTDTGSAQKGGDLGWFGRGQMVGEFEEAAFALGVGERSGIVESEYGFHIILLVDRKAAVRHEFAEVRDQVRSDLEKEQITEGAAAWHDAAVAAATIEITDPMLDAGWKKSQDLDAGLTAFERLYDERRVDEPYLPFIIGSLYEATMNNKNTERTALEAGASTDPASAEQFAALGEEIEEARVKALSFYEIALAAFSDDETIQERVKALTPQTSSESAI